MQTNDSAFTLLELLATMAIIAILTAIAIPQYAAYKRRAFDVRAASDLRNVAAAEEAYFMDEETYLSCSDDACSALPGISALSQGVTLEITADDTDFTGTATHPGGSGKIYEWDTQAGGMQP